MKDPQMDTIDQLRAMVKDLQSKLEYRTNLLAYLIPHVEYKAGPSNQSEYDYVAFEFCEKFANHIERFKDEYANEVQPNKDGKL